MKDLSESNKIEELCGVSIAYHCNRFDLKMPEEFMSPSMPKSVDSKKAVEKFINNSITSLFESLPSEILDTKKYQDTCDLIGATIMRLGKLKKDGSGTKTKH